MESLRVKVIHTEVTEIRICTKLTELLRTTVREKLKSNQTASSSQKKSIVGFFLKM